MSAVENTGGPTPGRLQGRVALASGRLLKAGIRPTISIDVCFSNGRHVFGAMRSLISTQRGDTAEATERGEPLDRVLLNCRELVEFGQSRAVPATAEASIGVNWMPHHF